MKSLLRICLLLAISTPHLLAAEALLAVAPQINISGQDTHYVEELANFYGTNIFILKSPLLSRHVSKQFKDPPSSIVVQVEQISKTSILQISVTGASEDQNQKYLDLLIQAFFDYRKQLFDATVQKKIDQLETAFKSTADDGLKEKLKLMLQSVQLAQTSYQDAWMRLGDH